MALRSPVAVAGLEVIAVMLNGEVPVGTKDRRPRLSPLLVSRPRLESLLAEAARPQVTLVCGPPGAGKTTLLASAFRAAADDSVSWLCLDERDNDAARLVALLHTALSRVAPGPPPSPTTLVPADGLVDDVLARLAPESGRRVLILDDVQELRTPAALAVLDRLLAQAPDSLDVVMASRVDPPVALHQLRLDGRLQEIRNAELALTLAETAELLALHEVNLAEEDVRALWSRTEGWAAGLRLAARTLQDERDPGRFVRSASRTEAVVSDYLLRELLVREDEAVQWFLMRTSVAERLTPELASLLSEDVRAPEYLLDMEHSGVLVAEEGHEGSYRYHTLFGALLRARLERYDAELARELHSRTAHWCLANDMPLAAQSHLQAAGDWDRFGQMLAWRWLDATLEGHDLAEAPLPDGVDPEVLRTVPHMALLAAADACRRSNRVEAEVYRDTLDDLLAVAGAGDDGPAGDLSWDSERLVLDVVLGRAFGATARSRQAAAILEDTSAQDPTAVSLRRFGALMGAELALDAGDLEQAGRRLSELAHESDRCWTSVEATALLALFDAAGGRLDGVTARCASVVDDPRGCATIPARQAAHLASALVLAQQGDCRRATATLAELPVADVSSRFLWMVDRCVRAGMSRRAGLPVTLDAATAEHPFAQLALQAMGVVTAVGADGRPFDIGGPAERAIVDARTRAGAGDLAEVDRAVRRWMVSDDATAVHPRILVEALVFAALGADARSEHADARRHLGDALDVAELRGIVAPILEHGPALTRLLDRHLTDLGDQKAHAVSLLDRLRPTGHGELVEALTDREMEVLVHLPTLMSNAEIAEGLHLSVNTVKTHLKAVYRKLGVEDRRQAVRRGRELELI